MISKVKKAVRAQAKGSILALIIIIVLILVILGLGLLQVAYGSRLQAIIVKNESIALMTAEAGYESALLWMGQQNDMLSVLSTADKKRIKGTLADPAFENSGSDYIISFYGFNGALPVYRVISNGYCGRARRTIDVLVTQSVGKWWDMDACSVPNSPWTAAPVFFGSGDLIGMPIHVNNNGTRDDRTRDIHVIGTPRFLSPVSVGESRYSRRNNDKYQDIMGLFENDRVHFNQPDRQIVTAQALAAKAARFKDDIKKSNKFYYKPKYDSKVGYIPNAAPATQLEFYLKNDVGMVRATNDCVVRLYDPGPMDYKIGTETPYEKYGIYGYHYGKRGSGYKGISHKITSTYVSQGFDKYQSPPGGQIYVDGNVIIGGVLPGVLKGRLTVVATGNIWIVNSVRYDDGTTTRAADGMPAANNPNALGLVSLNGVVKVIDPGISALDPEFDDSCGRYMYKPVGLPAAVPGPDNQNRILPNPLIVESAITVGGGGWGVENVGGTSVATPANLIVRGAINEAVRAVVGPGFYKNYFLDGRLATGILPGDIWVQSKYVPAPGGWSDYRPPH